MSRQVPRDDAKPSGLLPQRDLRLSISHIHAPHASERVSSLQSSVSRALRISGPEWLLFDILHRAPEPQCPESSITQSDPRPNENHKIGNAALMTGQRQFCVMRTHDASTGRVPACMFAWPKEVAANSAAWYARSAL